MSETQSEYSTSRDHFWWFVFAMVSVMCLGFAVGDATDGKWAQFIFDVWMVIFFFLTGFLAYHDTRRAHTEVIPNGPYAQARGRYDAWLEKKIHARLFDVMGYTSLIVFICGLFLFWRTENPVLLIAPAAALVILILSLVITITTTNHYGAEYEQTHGIEDTWFFSIDENDPQAISLAETRIVTAGDYPQPDDGNNTSDDDSDDAHESDDSGDNNADKTVNEATNTK